MNNKLKLILIALEVFALAVLILLGVGCQRKWIIVTGDGPRFDWYAVQEQLVPSLDIADDPSGEPSSEPSSEPESSEPEVTEPPVTTRPPETTAPPETAEPPSSEPDTPEDGTGNTDGTDSTGATEDRWSLGEF